MKSLLEQNFLLQNSSIDVIVIFNYLNFEISNKGFLSSFLLNY